MRVSTKGRYGTRAMLDVGLHADEGLVHLKDVAERQGISKKYLEHLVARLEADGLLRTVRGAGGGVALARPPSKVTVLDILHTLEGSLAPVECVDRPEVCPPLRKLRRVRPLGGVEWGNDRVPKGSHPRGSLRAPKGEG